MTEMTVMVKKAGQTMSIDPQEWPIEMYAEALRIGAEHMVNTKQSLVKTPTAQKLMSEADAVAERDSAMKIAEKNLKDIMAGSFKIGKKATAASKVSRELKTEALRLARNTVKDAIKAAGERISHVKASDITSAAQDLIDQDPEYMIQAKANLEANALKPKQKSEAELKAYVASLVSPELVTKAKEKAAAAKATSGDIISKTQAGLVKGRKKAPDAVVH